MSNRRNFLKTSAVLAASLAAGPLTGAQSPPAASLPKVRFGDAEISRLVIGTNPFTGWSHFNPLLDHFMAEWNTPERVCQTLLQCQQNGINAHQCSTQGNTQSYMDVFRARGGKMQLIVVDADKTRLEETVRSSGAGAVYHHGEVTDTLFRAGQMDQVQEYTKKLRQTGVRVGIGAHNPEAVEYVEERGWDVDFYVLCVYNRTRTPEEIRKLLGVVPVPASELYLETDPPRAYQVARQTSKTCILFKILAAGRLARSPQEVDKAFKDAFDNIKPQDCILVGMFPRFQDQVKENCDRVRRILKVNS
jgi:hypothetical protein